MPIHKTSGGEWQWGSHGAKYPTRAGAERQAAAAHANGFVGDDNTAVQYALESLHEELDAIRLYGQRILTCGDKSLVAVMKHNIVEERDHAMRLLGWLKENL